MNICHLESCMTPSGKYSFLANNNSFSASNMHYQLVSGLQGKFPSTRRQSQSNVAAYTRNILPPICDRLIHSR